MCKDWTLDSLITNLSKRIKDANNYMSSLEYVNKSEAHKKECEKKLAELLADNERLQRRASDNHKI